MTAIMLIKIAISVFAGMAWGFLLHVWWWRRFPSNTPRLALLAGFFLSGLGVSLGGGLCLLGINPLALMVTLSFHIFLSTAYAYLYSGICRSVSVTVLICLLEQGSILREVFYKYYRESSRFEERIELMHRAGLVEVLGETASLTPRGAQLVRFIGILNNCLGTVLEG